MCYLCKSRRRRREDVEVAFNIRGRRRRRREDVEVAFNIRGEEEEGNI